MPPPPPMCHHVHVVAATEEVYLAPELACRLQLGDTAPRGGAASKGARLCPEDQPQRVTNRKRVGRIPAVRLQSSRCGWASPQPRSGNLRGARPFCQILIECNSALRAFVSTRGWPRCEIFGLASFD